MSRFRTPLISWPLACILIGLPTPSSVQSTLEYDGITDPVRCARTAATYGERSIRPKSRRFVTGTPWSIVYESVVEVPYSVSPSPA